LRGLFLAMQTTVVVAGFGLCGMWTSYWLYKNNVPFMVLEPGFDGASTPVASGVINPVTGRRLHKTWMAETLLPFAATAYQEMGQMIGQDLIHNTGIVDFFGAPDKRLIFSEKAALLGNFLAWPEDENDHLQWFNYGLGYGKISPAYWVDLQQMIDGWAGFLKKRNLLVEAPAGNFSPMEISEGRVKMGEINAEKLLLCTGKWAADSGLFCLLPFALNKGEALLVKPNDPTIPSAIYKKTNTLLPWRNGLWWAGSTYDNRYQHEDPTPAFRKNMEDWLHTFLKEGCEVVDHIAAVRPATVERRPFAGWHPAFPSVGIINGMGTKGVSLAPWVCSHMVDNIVSGKSLPGEIDVMRFARILAKA